MNIGILAVDSNFPNLALMKISAYHKARGDQVEWYNPLCKYDKVYAAKVFTFTPDYNYYINANQIEKGGTGYDIEFVEKLAEHGNGIALLFNRCDSNKFQDIIFTKATGMMFLRNRIKFFRPDGTRGDSPGCGSVLIAFGRENAEILRNCSLQGKYVELNNDK